MHNTRMRACCRSLRQVKVCFGKATNERSQLGPNKVAITFERLPIGPCKMVRNNRHSCGPLRALTGLTEGRLTKARIRGNEPVVGAVALRTCHALQGSDGPIARE
jgi:hypothetical protein